ncbi:MAG: type II secretion system protein GspM [Candidatus Azotimanducaceae bacterium]|uniref:Type II secretion system protein M n=1 Tax=OM182 bacterium TaxID=2510334 RepID=A0A520RZA0_9GAMM|nr:MAG: type II secretion system protein M [OM182 bacterium]
MSFKKAFSHQLERLNSLDVRERSALKVLVLSVGVLALYTVIWLPIHYYHEASLRQRDTQFSLLQYMRSSEQQVRAVSGAMKQRSTGQSLITDISNAAKESGIQPNRIQPESGDVVSVWFDNVVFNDLIGWVGALHEEYGVSVEQISIDRRAAPGHVSARVVLGT